MFLRKPSSGCGWLVVGLGNPGKQYEHSRHNVGFDTLDILADRLHVRVDRIKFKALTGMAEIGGEKVLLMKPQTFMNLSGEAVRQAADFYKLPPERILVIFDDISLDPGRLRIRASGSAGGHNGIKSIIAQLGSQDFPRIKVGVGAKPHPDYDLADWVLGKFSGEDKKQAEAAMARAADAVEAILTTGPEKAASKFNGK
jgi:PTH1 family peptidyl-tRNA hydrolase